MMPTPYEMLIFWPIGVVLVGLLVIGMVKLLERTTDKSGFAADYRQFMDSAQARGLSFYDSCLEWQTRTAFHRLRREASEAVAANPANWQEALDGAVQATFTRLASENPDILPLFAQMVKGLPYSDILHTAETKMVDRLVAGMAKSAPSIDQRGALRVR